MANLSPLVYSQLRMMAEAAHGLRDGAEAAALFNLPGSETSPDTNVLGPVLVPLVPWRTDSVIVPMRNTTKFTDPGAVLIEVQGAFGSVDAVAHNADAVFWSGAAVQKFVLPYYASCTGYDAYAALTTLQQAWNAPHAGTQVIALMHVIGTPVGSAPDTPLEPLWVVFLQDTPTGPTVQTEPLSVFSQRPAGTIPQLTRPAPAAYQPPASAATGAPYPDYPALRSLAEWSMESDTGYFRWDPALRRFAPAAGEGNGSEIVILVSNPISTNGSPVVPTVTFAGEALEGDIDAVCWSTGAIEQFLLPYYASIDGFAGLPDLQALRNAWIDNVPTLGGNRLVGGVDTPVTGPVDGEVLGIIHFIRSMYETDVAPTGSTFARRELATFTRSEGVRPGREAAVTAAGV